MVIMYANMITMGMIKLPGKSAQQIAKEYGVTSGRVRQFALESIL